MATKKPKTGDKVRSSTGKVVKLPSKEKNAKILKDRTTRKKGVGRRSVKEGHTGSGVKTGRSQYVNKAKKANKIKKTAGVKKAAGPKAKALMKKKK